MIFVVGKAKKVANGIQIAYTEKYLMIINKNDNRQNNISNNQMNSPVWLRAERNEHRLSRCEALLSNYDFMEARVKSMEGDSIVLSSVVIVMRCYEPGKTVQALFLKSIAIENNAGVVLNDGVGLVFRNIDIANNKVLIQTITEDTYEVPIKLIN